MKRHSKFNNKKCTYKGLKFDSLLERDRFIYLEGCQKDGIIHSLDRQVRYPLVVGGELICHYIADFEYKINGKIITEDVKCKATITPVFRLKRKLFNVFYLRDINVIFSASTPCQ